MWERKGRDFQMKKLITILIFEKHSLTVYKHIYVYFRSQMDNEWKIKKVILI